jgi:hypothetical protein
MKFKNVAHGHPANAFEAFRQLAYSFGVPELAQCMGLKPGTLYNKADADEETHHQPTLRDVLLATRLTGDMRVLDAMDEQFGRAAFDVSHMDEQSDEALLELLASLGAESGEFHAALRQALADKRFSTQELVHVRAHAFDMVSALMTLVARLEGLVDE